MKQRLLTVVPLVGSCAVLGVWVALLLTASLGSDGYSTLINGRSMAMGVDCSVVNAGVGLALAGLAWCRRVRPGLGPISQRVVVGLMVSGLLAVVPQPDQPLARSALLLISLPVVAVGVAGYLATETGAGPTEAVALAFDQPSRCAGATATSPADQVPLAAGGEVTDRTTVTSRRAV